MATKTFAGWILGLAMVFGLTAAAFLSSGAASAAPGDSVGHSSTRAAPARSSDANSLRPNGFATLLNNRTPTLAPTHTIPVGRVVHGQLHANDPDGDSLTYSVAMNPAHGSVVLSGDDYTYTLDQSLAQTGATDSFQVAVSDAGRGFHIHGLAGLINLLSFGIVGSSGHTAVGTISVSVPGLPVDPAPDPVGVLRPEDLTFEGLFRVPTGVIGDGDYATLAYGGAAMASREVDGQRRFFFTGHRYANDPLVEVAAPDTLGLTPETATVATVVHYWGDIYGGSKTTAEEPDGSVPNANWTEGLLWDEAGQRLFWSYGNWYAASHDNNPVLGATELGADGSISVQGPWRTTSDPQQTRSFALFLPDGLSAATGGATMGLGGKMQSINASASWGPDLHAIASPAPDRPDGAVIPADPLMAHPLEPLDQRSPREPDYQVALDPAGSIDTAGTQPPVDGVGFWTELDETTGATFVRTGAGDRGALVYSGGQAYGLIWYGPDFEHGVGDGRGYDGKGNHAEHYRPMLWFVSEQDLIDSADGLVDPSEVNPYQAIDLTRQFPELAFAEGLTAGQPVFAADEGRLYVPILGGYVENRTPYPLVAVFSVAG